MRHKIPHPCSAAYENAASLTGIRDDVFIFYWSYFRAKHKVPPSYSRAEDCARSLTVVGMTVIKLKAYDVRSKISKELLSR
jgi:hypothetical protein